MGNFALFIQPGYYYKCSASFNFRSETSVVNLYFIWASEFHAGWHGQYRVSDSNYWCQLCTAFCHSLVDKLLYKSLYKLKKRNGTFHYNSTTLHKWHSMKHERKQTNKQNKNKKTRPCALPTELILCQMEKTNFIMGNTCISDTVGHYKYQGSRFKLDGQVYFFQLTFMFCGLEQFKNNYFNHYGICMFLELFRSGGITIVLLPSR